MHRLRQGLRGFHPSSCPDLEHLLAGFSPAVRAAFMRLSRYDQRHLRAVHDFLVRQGESNADLLTAALLHDLGKAALGGHVRLIDRTLNVLLAAWTPALHRRLTKLPAPSWRIGLVLAARHPELGAAWAHELGLPERVCWLIAHHADLPIPDDPALRRLVEADRRA